MLEMIDCDECDGLGFRVRRCVCVQGGDQLVVNGDGYADQAYADCRVCGGDGGVAAPCWRCGRAGRRRAQLVVTVVNLDTGAAASRRLLPGRLDPPADPDNIIRARDVVAGLAGTVGVRGLCPRWGRALDDEVYWLPRRWRADLPARERLVLEAEALAGQEYEPWRVYVGRGSEAPPPREPGRELARLCELADLLHLDLVVEARRQHGAMAWAIRYELPGGPVPLDRPAHAWDLPSAVAATTFREAMRGLDERGRDAPAHTVRPVRTAGVPARVDLDRLGRAVRADLADDAPGAQAVWRDGRWWHTPLRSAGSVEELRECATGQIVRRVRQLLRRAVEPPDPVWWGEPVEHRPCPDCRPGTRLRRCHCRLGAPGPDPRCSRCSGAGFAPSGLACFTCRDGGRIPAALTVTVTDLRRVRHETWCPVLGESAPVVGYQPNGTPVYQLPPHWRLARHAPTFAVRPVDLTRLDEEQPVDQDLLDGTVTVFDPAVEPARQHVERIGAGLPGARLFVLAAAPDAPSLTDLLRLAHALDLAVLVTYCDHRLDAGDPTRVQGERWDIRLAARDAPVEAECPFRASVELAVARCVEDLDSHLLATVPREPDRPVPAPWSAPSLPVADPTGPLRRVGQHYAGQLVVVSFDRTGCRLWLAEGEHVQPLARAATLDAAVSALRLPGREY
ncbi:hypothetical protein [Salinispora tropica]|uniref:Uncharacterized protein n=1 Tax=Salinispora tropica (strain ATCC BAA-916 / DSM 44818 / JCM 13857 / NBRC 105044 / CNB-440) TaxID=369723 RepID=A4X537_SALTO|nr:hypothetical protein [Salinispora tropica]ABP53987.1 hypothetical protein Strop_1521 [Salinispora tropica CNB-440]